MIFTTSLVVRECILCLLLVAIACVDARTKHIPNKAIILLFLLGVLYLLVDITNTYVNYTRYVNRRNNSDAESYVNQNNNPDINSCFYQNDNLDAGSYVIQKSDSNIVSNLIQIDNSNAYSYVNQMLIYDIYNKFLGLIFPSFPLYLFYLFSGRRLIGGADIRLLSACGLILGYRRNLYGFAIGIFVCAIIKLFLYIIGRRERYFALSPYLVAGVILQYLLFI